MDGYAVIIETVTDRDLTEDQVDTIALTASGSAAYNSAGRSLRLVLRCDAPTMPDAIAEALGMADRAARAAGFAYSERDELRVLPHARLESETFRPSVPRAGLAGTAEAAEILGVTRQRIAEIRKTHAGFPQPVEELSATPVWDRAQVEQFARGWDRSPGRPRKATGGKG